jgi:hypothetical protein
MGRLGVGKVARCKPSPAIAPQLPSHLSVDGRGFQHARMALGRPTSPRSMVRFAETTDMDRRSVAFLAANRCRVCGIQVRRGKIGQAAADQSRCSSPGFPDSQTSNGDSKPAPPVLSATGVVRGYTKGKESMPTPPRRRIAAGRMTGAGVGRQTAARWAVITARACGLLI